MNSWRQWATLALLAATFATFAFPPMARADAPAPGSPAPDFAAQTTAGKALRLTDLRRKVVLLDFWAVACPPCRLQMPHLQRLSRKYAKNGLIVVGVTQMNPTNGALRNALRQSGVTYPVVTDPGEKIGQRIYQIEAHPTTVLIDRAGRIAHVETGYLKGDEKNLEARIRALLAAGPRKGAGR